MVGAVSTMKSIKIRIISISIIFLLLFIPSSQVIGKKIVEKEYNKRFNRLINVDGFFENSVFKKILGIFELLTGVGLCILITQLLSLRVLPLILEIGFGPVIFLLAMALLLTIPVQLLNGICLLIQKQFSLGQFQTVILTVFSFFVYVLGNFIVKSTIPFYVSM